jgi:hypothetical protein
MQRIVLFLAAILIAGSIGVAVGWPSGRGLIPRADLVTSASPTPTPAPNTAAGGLRVTPHPSIKPAPTPQATPTPSAAPAPSLTPTPPATPMPSIEPYPAPVHTGCGQCGQWTGPGPRPAIMCPMQMTANYCMLGQE